MGFQINNIWWQVVYVPPLSNSLLRSDLTRTVGVTDLSKGKIFISDALRGEFLRKVIIHEVCHAAMFSRGVSVSLEIEEMICDFIATHGDEVIGIADDIFRVIRRVA